MFVFFYNFGIFTAFQETDNTLEQAEADELTAHPCRIKAMKVERFNLFITISTFFVIAGIILLALNLNRIQSHARNLSSYKHPCIVLTVDNHGCQTELVMRTRIAVAAR